MANTITLGALKTSVRNRLSDPSFDGDVLTQFANDTNREICNTRRWRFMEAVFTGTVGSSSQTYALPTGFQAAIDFTLQLPNSNAMRLDYVPYEEFDRLYPNPSGLTPTTPDVWSFFGTTLIIGAAPLDQTYTMQLRYLKLPTTLVNDTDLPDVPDEFSELMVLGMLLRSMQVNDYYDQAQVIAQSFDLGMDAMTERLQSRQLGQLPSLRSGRQKRWL